MADLCRSHGITEQTYYRWESKYGGLELSELQRLKQLEDENRRLKHIVAEQTLDIQASKAMVEKSGRPDREARGGRSAPCRHNSIGGVVRVAIVTPCSNEPRQVIERAVRSVGSQYVPEGVEVDHFLVGDGVEPPEPADGLYRLTLPKAGHDYGDTPRAVGIALAASLNYDAITLLDADCYLLPGALLAYLTTAEAEHVNLVVGRRLLARHDGTALPIVDEPIDSHIDTNCYFALRGAFGVLVKWALIPEPLHVIGDRIMRLATVAAGLKYAVVPEATVVYPTEHAVHYLSADESPPATAKDLRHTIAEMWQTWDSLAPEQRFLRCAALGFGIRRTRWAVSSCSLEEL